MVLVVGILLFSTVARFKSNMAYIKTTRDFATKLERQTKATQDLATKVEAQIQTTEDLPAKFKALREELESVKQRVVYVGRLFPLFFDVDEEKLDKYQRIAAFPNMPAFIEPYVLGTRESCVCGNVGGCMICQ